MATRYFKSGATVWNNAASWSAVSSSGTDNAGVPVTNATASLADDVVFDSGSGSCTVNITVGTISAGLRSINFSGYAGTITMSNIIYVATTGTLTTGVANVTTSGASAIYLIGSSTLTSGGGAWGGNIHFGATAGSTKTLTSNFRVLGSTTTGSTLTLSGSSFTYTSAGLVVGNTLSGDASITLTGGTWSGNFAVRTNLTFAGNVTVSGNVNWTPGSTNTLTYSSGTITTTGSTLTTTLTGTAANTVFNTSGMTWNNILFSGVTNSQVTFASDLVMSGSFTQFGTITNLAPTGTGAIRAGSWTGTAGQVTTLNTNWFINSWSFNSYTFNTNKVFVNTLITPVNTSSVLAGTVEVVVTSGTIAGLGVSSGYGCNLTIAPAASSTVTATGNIRFTGIRTYKADLSAVGSTFNAGTSLLSIGASNTLDMNGALWYDAIVSSTISFSVISTFTITNTMTIQAAFTISSSGGSSGTFFNPTGTLVIGNTAADMTLSIPTNLTVQNLTIINRTAGTTRTILSGNTINVTQNLTIQNNDATTASSTIINFSGSTNGTWSGNFTVFNPITINKTSGGILTIGSSLVNNSVKFAGTSFTYTSGAIDASTYLSTLNIVGSTTFTGTSNVTWYNILTTANITLTINTSALTWSNVMTVPGTLTFTSATSVGFNGAFFTVTYVSTNILITFRTGTTYFLARGLTLAGGVGSGNLSLTSSTSTDSFLSLANGATQSVRYVGATDIDSSGGQTIWNYKGTNNSTVNWNLLTAPGTVSSTFAY